MDYNKQYENYASTKGYQEYNSESGHKLRMSQKL